MTFLTAFCTPLPQKTLFVAVAQFDGFVFAGAGAAGNGRATGRAAFERHVHFHRRVAARIKNFARLNILDFCHKKSSGHHKSWARRVKKS